MIVDRNKKLNCIARAIREDVLEMTHKSGVNGGHLGGAFSSAEILAALYGNVMNISPESVSPMIGIGLFSAKATQPLAIMQL